MRVVLFILVSFVAAAGFGTMAWMQGHGAGVIALRVAIVFGLLQLAYVGWIVAAALLAPSDASDRGAAGRGRAASGRKPADRSAR